MSRIIARTCKVALLIFGLFLFFNSPASEHANPTEAKTSIDGEILGAEALVGTITFYCSEIFPEMGPDTKATRNLWYWRNQKQLEKARASRDSEVETECANHESPQCKDIYLRELDLVLEENSTQLMIKMESLSLDERRSKCEEILGAIDSGTFDVEN